MSDRELEAEIYVDTNLAREELVEMVARAIVGRVGRFVVLSDVVNVSVGRNPDSGGYFGRFHHYMEVAPEEGANESSVVSAINKIVAELKSRNIAYEVACGFEDKIV